MFKGIDFVQLFVKKVHPVHLRVRAINHRQRLTPLLGLASGMHRHTQLRALEGQWPILRFGLVTWRLPSGFTVPAVVPTGRPISGRGPGSSMACWLDIGRSGAEAPVSPPCATLRLVAWLWVHPVIRRCHGPISISSFLSSKLFQFQCFHHLQSSRSFLKYFVLRKCFVQWLPPHWKGNSSVLAPEVVKLLQRRGLTTPSPF